jgi:4-amino-4-deoxy-L-arabinose transferase-like glycosyltransferase
MHETKSIGGIIAVIIFLWLGLCYSYYTPLWTPPDEERHFAYCEYIAQNHTLPEFKSSSKENSISMAFHPPLYFLIGSFFCKDDGKLLEEEVIVNDGPGFIDIAHPQEETKFPYAGKARSAHLIRLFSLVLSALTIYLIYLLALQIFPDEMIFASATALFVATIPQFLYASASVSNDTITATLSTAYILSLLYYAKDPFNLLRSVVCGLLLGLCLLAKSTTLFYVVVTACILIWICFQERILLIRSFFVFFGTAFLVAGWWYLRNWFIANDFLLTRTVAEQHPWFLQRGFISVDDVRKMITQTFTSFFGHFGSLQFTIQEFHLYLYGAITLLGIIGLCYGLAKGKMTQFQSRGFGVLFIALLGGMGMYLFLNSKYIGLSMGRYLFIVIAPIALLVFGGIRFVLSPRWRNPVLIVLSIVLSILNLQVVFRTLRPVYAEISLIKVLDQPFFSYPTTEISSAVTISQSFISSQNNLAAIQVMFSSRNPLKRGEITFSLMDAGDLTQALYRINLPLEEIEDWNKYYFVFPPIKDSIDKTYTFSIQAPSLPGETGLALWHSLQDVYPDGTMFVNSTPASGDLTFSAYCFTGENPQTDWEGKRLAVIKQGPYISFREWQLYIERSNDFRSKTLTHEKILLFQNAFKNRKALAKKNDHA